MQNEPSEESPPGYSDPVFTDEVATSNYPVFKGPATL